MAHDRLSRYTYVLTAWLHYRCGMSTANLVALLAHSGLAISPGALTQGWQRLGTLLAPAYDQILARVKRSLVLMADETGWRIHGVTHWLWYFGCPYWSYYLIDRHRGTAVVTTVIGTVFAGMVLVDFWGAYHAIKTWAKQRGIFPLFTALTKVDLQRPHDAVWRDFRQRVTRLFKDCLALRRHAQRHGHLVARAHQGQGRSPHAVQLGDRHHADAARSRRRARADEHQRGETEAHRRHEPGVYVR